MMKTTSDPRRIYFRNNITHVCFNGLTFGAPVKSTVSLNFPVTIEKLKSDGGRARVQVTQRREHQKALIEIWRTVYVPSRTR